MANLLVIFGITGQQGASVAEHVLQDKQLSQMYRIRGLTRDASKPEAQAFSKRGVEVVEAELDDAKSVKAALNGAHTVFAMTVSVYEPGGQEREVQQGKRIADACAAAGVQMLVYSTVPSPDKLTSGKYPVGSFDCKDEVKGYIESVCVDKEMRCAFFAPGCFMQNFHGHMGPRPGPDGELAITNFVSPDTPYSLIDIAGDTGKFVGAILAQPDEYAGKTFCASSEIHTIRDIAAIMSKACGKPVKYNQIPKDVFGKFLPEANRDTLLNMLSYFEYCGYYGHDSPQLVDWAATHARGNVSSLEQFLQREPLKV